MNREKTEVVHRSGPWVALIWVLSTLALLILDRALIQSALKVEVTPHAIEFSEISVTAFALTLVSMFALLASSCFLHPRKHLPKVIVVVIALLNWYWLYSKLQGIEFTRTPPCWGIHSIDPGSGVGCPDGMREDFTAAQLRAYYDQKQ